MASGMPIAVEVYASPQGRSAFIEWLESIPDLKTVQRIRHRIERIELGNLGDCLPVKSSPGLFEMRLFFGPGYRIYFALPRPGLAVLLCGGDKGTQRRDIQKAKALFASYRSE
jgi:putative addiction module killer protein